jgi:hypothetical protein
MNYSSIIKELNKASLFDLYRLDVAINMQLDDPSKLREIKNHLKIDQEISYFDLEGNRLIRAIILKIKRKHLSVRNIEDGQRWSIPLYMVNLDDVNTDVQLSASNKVDRSSLQVGDKVCFKNREGKELYGDVFKLNPKTAGIMVGDVKWRVHYGYLSLIIEGESAGKQQLLR